MTQLILCGPQARLPSEPDLGRLRLPLQRRASLCTALASAARGLPALLRLFAAFDASLSAFSQPLFSSSSTTEFLLQWLESGTLSQPVDSLPNVVALPFAVLLQIALFLQHLDHGDVDYSQAVDSLQQYGVQGFCTGFLTATAIALSASEDQLADHAATSVRLAAAIGALIDKDARESEPVSLLVRWREREYSRSQVDGLLAAYPHVSGPRLRRCPF